MNILNRQQLWATVAYRAALTAAFCFSVAGILAGGLAMQDWFDMRSPMAWWFLLVLINPFLALGIRHFYSERFDVPWNRTLLAFAVVALLMLHVALTLTFR